MAKTKIGLLTVGQSPRPEYTSGHRNALRAMGVDVEVIESAPLDGLSYEEVRALDCSPMVERNQRSPEIGIGAHVRKKGSYDKRMGQDWLPEPVWLSRKKLIPLIQKCIDKLEKEGAELIMLCCIEEYPENAFSSKVPFLLPYKACLSYARALVDTMAKPGIGLLVPDQRHYDQDVATWTNRYWQRDINLHVGVGDVFGDSKGVTQIAGKKLDLVFFWGYGASLEPGDPEGQIADFERQLGAPVITPSAANLLCARALLRPALAERSFIDWNG